MTTTVRSGEDRPPVTVIGLGAMGSALDDAEPGPSRPLGGDCEYRRERG